jgi:CBS domain-containing protein
MKHRTVAAVMTPAEKVVTVRPGTAYKEIARLLTEHEISALPVLGEDHRVLGIVSEADLLPKESRSQTSPSAHPPWTPAQARSRHKAEAATALELMTAPAVTITAEEDVSEAARRMESHRIKRLPVIDANRRLVGIVSRRDILRLFLRSDEELLGDVRTLLVEDFWIAPQGWDAEVTDGTVRLTGVMETRSTARIAENAVRRIDGVVAVESELTFEFDDTAVKPDGEPPFHGVFSGHRRDRDG